MGMEFGVILRKTKGDTITIFDSLCGRSEMLNDVISCLGFYANDTDEFIINEDSLPTLRQALEIAYTERHRLEGEFKKLINEIKTNTMLMVSAQCKDIGADAKERVQLYEESLENDFSDSYYYMNHLINVLDIAESSYVNLEDRENFEIVLYLSY